MFWDTLTFWDSTAFSDAVGSLGARSLVWLALAILIAFAFEFINGFHDTANAVTTVIYTRTLTSTPAVLYSAVMNFLGVLIGGTGVAFGIVKLLPADALDAESGVVLSMVLSLLVAGVLWNLGTWYVGLPVSSSHTLIGSILGVGVTHGLLTGKGVHGVDWNKATDVGLGLLLSPLMGFVGSAALLLVLKKLVPTPRLYMPPVGHDRPPNWIRAILITTCGGVSFAHGANDGQKGMGLLMLVLLGFLPVQYALNNASPENLPAAQASVVSLRKLLPAEPPKELTKLNDDLTLLAAAFEGKATFDEVPAEERRATRQAIQRVTKALAKEETVQALDPAGRADLAKLRKPLAASVEYIPIWVIVGTAFALGIGTTVGYKRIVQTIAEKIGKAHLTYAQGAVAELVAALTITAAVFVKLPVSTTQIMSSGIAGTMVANGNGVQGVTVRNILLAWVATLPATMLLSGGLYAIARQFVS